MEFFFYILMIPLTVLFGWWLRGKTITLKESSVYAGKYEGYR